MELLPNYHTLKIPVITRWPSRNSVDHDLQVMIDGSGGVSVDGDGLGEARQPALDDTAVRGARLQLA